MIRIEEFYAPMTIIEKFGKLCQLTVGFCESVQHAVHGLLPTQLDEVSPTFYIKTLLVKKAEIESVYEELKRYSEVNTFILTSDDRSGLSKKYNNAKIIMHNTLSTLCAYYNQDGREVTFSHELFINSDFIRAKFAFLQEIAYNLRLTSIELPDELKYEVYRELTRHDVKAWQREMNALAKALSFTFTIQIPKSKLNTLR